MVTNTGSVYALKEAAFGEYNPTGLVTPAECLAAKEEVRTALEGDEREERLAELDEMEEAARQDRLARVSGEVVQKLRLGEAELARRRRRSRGSSKPPPGPADPPKPSHHRPVG